MANHLSLEAISVDQCKQFVDACVAGEQKVGGFLAALYPEPCYTMTPVPQKFPEPHAAFHAKPQEEKQEILKIKPTIRENFWWDWRNLIWGTRSMITSATYWTSPGNPTLTSTSPLRVPGHSSTSTAWKCYPRSFLVSTCPLVQRGTRGLLWLHCRQWRCRFGLLHSNQQLEESWVREKHPGLWVGTPWGQAIEAFEDA